MQTLKGCISDTVRLRDMQFCTDLSLFPKKVLQKNWEKRTFLAPPRGKKRPKRQQLPSEEEEFSRAQIHPKPSSWPYVRCVRIWDDGDLPGLRYDANSDSKGLLALAMQC